MIREYRVKPVIRYIVTEWSEDSSPEGGRVTQTRQMGEFDNEAQGDEVAMALAIATGGYVEKAAAPARGEDHAIFAGLPTYKAEDGEVRPTPPSPFA